MNPAVLVEVLSPGTEAYDRGEKATQYRSIPSLREYLLVSHRERRIQRFWRSGSGAWEKEIPGKGDLLRLAALGIELDVDAIYDRSPLTRGI